MHVARIRSGYTDKRGQRREYESAYLRRTYREAGKVRHETLASLSGLPEATVDSIEAALKGTALVPAADAVRITRSLPHGHVAAVHAMAVKLGLPGLLGPAGPDRDLALALVIVAGPSLPVVSRPPTWAPARRPPAASTRRWTGSPGARTRSRPGWPAATWARRPTPRGWRCSTCPVPGWRADAARWPPGATPGTARKAGCRSSTGC